MKRFFYVCLILLSFSFGKGEEAFAQTNLVPNPSFEVYDTCPGLGVRGIENAIPWLNPSTMGGSPDYMNVCAISTPDFYVPSNSWGFEYAHSGVAYAGLVAYAVDIQYQTPIREYIQVKLSDTLMVGKNYCVSFYVSLADNSTNHAAYKQVAITEMGLYFSNNSITANNWLPLPYTPQVNSPANVYLNDTANWVQITGTYSALGGEKYITIGNFKGNNTDTITIINTIYSPYAYYYVDDVSVVDCTVGVDELTDDEQISIYPNPSQGIFEVKSEKYKIQSIEVFNVLGEKIYKEELKDVTATINLQAPPGVYFMQVQTEKGILRKKFVKE